MDHLHDSNAQDTISFSKENPDNMSSVDQPVISTATSTDKDTLSIIN